VVTRWALHPGGGGQESDHAILRHAERECRILNVRMEDARYWDVLNTGLVWQPGRAQVLVDAQRRSVLAQVHTATHIMNALVFRKFAGALVTGAQISGDGTARMDFNLPDVDNDLPRAIEPEINEAIARGLRCGRSMCPRRKHSRHRG
jgi:misacylated tRNA(Ala) deacylase